MPMNVVYHGPSDLPAIIPVFPLPGALLLPRGQMPLNIFEPRYLAMIDDTLADRHRLIGMIQPDSAHPGADDRPNLYKIGCAGRITQLAETGDGRYLIELTGVTRFRIMDEPSVLTPYRQCRVDYHPFADDLVARMRNIRLDHPDQPMAVAQGIVDHRKVTRLENIERHLAARQQQRARQRKHRDHLGKVAGPAIFGIDRHRRSRCLVADYT